MQIHVDIVSAFINENTGGNKAGVVLNADSLTVEQKQYIATEVGLPETAFVSNSNVADVKLEFFTPSKQIAHCGHATIAVFTHLQQQGVFQQGMFSKETIDGNRDIIIESSHAFMQQLAPQFTDLKHDNSAILQACGLPSEHLISAPFRVDTGNGFIVLGVDTLENLAAIKPDFALMTQLSKKYDLVGFYLFTLDAKQQAYDASSRMFAPYYGINEESATGMAAGPLACYLKDIMNIHKSTFLIAQGELMATPSPSLIHVNLEIKNGKINTLMAGGSGKKVDNKIIRL